MIILYVFSGGLVVEYPQVTEKLPTKYEVVGTASSILDRYLAGEPCPNNLMLHHMEQVVMCVLSLACKMHQSDAATAAIKANPMLSAKLSAHAMANLEVQIGSRLEWHLNPPTPAVLIHHLLDFLPVRQKTDAMVVALTRQANELAIQALQGKRLIYIKCQDERQASHPSPPTTTIGPISLTCTILSFPSPSPPLQCIYTPVPFLIHSAHVVAVSAILGGFARLRENGAHHLPERLEDVWLGQLEDNGIRLCEVEVSTCLEKLGIDPMTAFGNKFAMLEELCVDRFMNSFGTPPEEEEEETICNNNKSSSTAAATTSTTTTTTKGLMSCPRSVSPTGVDEIGLLESINGAIKPFGVRPTGFSPADDIIYYDDTSSTTTTTSTTTKPPHSGPLFTSNVQSSAFSSFARCS